MRSWGIGVGAALAVATCAIVVAGCGGDSGGPVTLNLSVRSTRADERRRPPRSAASSPAASTRSSCRRVANSADASRELLVRRLAAGDKNIDMINMDTIWTPEFAEAGWLRELKGAEKEDALDDVLDGPADRSSGRARPTASR